MIAHLVEHWKAYAAGAQLVAAVALAFTAWELGKLEKRK